MKKLPPTKSHEYEQETAKSLAEKFAAKKAAEEAKKGKHWYSWMLKEKKPEAPVQKPAVAPPAQSVAPKGKEAPTTPKADVKISDHVVAAPKLEEKTPELKVQVPEKPVDDAKKKPITQSTSEPAPKKHWYSWAFKPEKKTAPKIDLPTLAPVAAEKKPAEKKGVDAKDAQKKNEAPTLQVDKKKPSFFDRFRRHKPSATATAAKSGKKEDAEKAADEITEKMHTSRLSKKKPRRKLQRKSLQEYLRKAGYEADAEKLKHRGFTAIVTIFFILSCVVLFQGSRYGAGVLDLIIFFLGLWTVVFILIVLISLGGMYFFLDYRIYRRTRELERVLPDFLQLASSNIAAGMPIDRALWYSIRPNFGVLAKEMEEVAKATMSGESLEQSLINFSDKFESAVLKRSVSILIEGLHSGGELADLLDKIAVNIQEMQIMRKELAANVTTYAIFIIVACVAVAPVLFALATQLLIIITQITGSIDLSSSQGLFAISAVDPQIVKNFKIFSYLMLCTSTICGAGIVSVITKGNVLEGIKVMPIYAIISFIIYAIALSVLGVMFGSLI